MLLPGYFIALSISNYLPIDKWTFNEHLQYFALLIWGLISCYLPVQVTRILIAKHNINSSPLKLNFLRGIYYLLFSIIIQIGLFFPWMALMGIGRYLTLECVEDHSILSMRILVGIFIVWTCYKNINNFKKLFTREFWDLKIIMMACLRFIGLSTFSGLMLYGISLILDYISKLF